MVTVVPAAPVPGVNDEMVGTAAIEKLLVLLPVPCAEVAVVTPVVAPAGTVAVAVVPVPVLNTLAGVPLKLTPVKLLRLVPVSVTLVPAAPLVGEKLLMVGEVRAMLYLLAR